jgi:hypothetical protein
MDHERTYKKIFKSKMEGTSRRKDLDCDGWKLYRRLYGKGRLRDGDIRQLIRKNGHL